MKINPEATRMYPNGPYRLFSETPFLGCVPYAAAGMKGFAGSFICALCQRRAKQIIWAAGEWVCEGCSRPAALQRESRAIGRKMFGKDDAKGTPRTASAVEKHPKALAAWPLGIGPPVSRKPADEGQGGSNL